jgi:hypothetical protein
MLDMLLPQMSLIFDVSMRHVFFEQNEAWLGSSLIVLVSIRGIPLYIGLLKDSKQCIKFFVCSASLLR